MDIAKAGEQIRGAVEAYLLKDAAGAYEIPFEHQRPIILMGPPGVGKTAIVAQVADELGINFVSYSITHHTRQSALGLPYIVERSYRGRTVSVSEYTMSEIIAAVLDAREASGIDEGILFLDEVNCASETLAPSMLQFLQFKTFGQHRLPEGWTIVGAGNPPEYNRSAREFDPAMLDRLKRIDVEADLSVWIAYALSHGIHPAITSYLEAKPSDFYAVRAGVRGTRMVTARGWEDLSRIIKAYERISRDVEAALIGQYLQDDAISSDFAAFYELFNRHGNAYRIGSILDGEDASEAAARLSAAPFDERVAVAGLLADALGQRARAVMVREDALRLVRDDLIGLKPFVLTDEWPTDAVDRRIADSADDGARQAAWSFAMPSKRDVMTLRTSLLCEMRDECARVLASGGMGDADAGGGLRADAFEAMRLRFNALCEECASDAATLVEASDRAIAFIEGAAGDGDELLSLVGRLSGDPVFVRFTGEHGGERFLAHAGDVLLGDKNAALLEEIDAVLGESGRDGDVPARP